MRFLQGLADGSGEARFSGRTALIFILAILALLYFSYAKNRDCLQIGLDGTAYSIYLDQQAVDRAPFTEIGIDATQGSFDAYYPLFREYLLPTALALPFTNVVPGKAAIYFIYSAFLILAIYLLARALDIEPQAALLGGFLFNIVGLPGIVHSFGHLVANFTLNPFWCQNVILSLLIVATFWALGSARRATAIILAFAPAMLLLIAIVSTGAQIIFMIPAVALYGSASVTDARRWRDNIPRFIAAVLMILIPLALGVGTYFYGLISYSAYDFFALEFQRFSFGWESVSAFWFSSFGRWAIILGVLGAAWTAYTESGRKRRFAIVHLIVTAIFMPVAYWIVFLARDYHGSMPIYFEMCILPFAMLFAAIAILSAARIVVNAFGEALKTPAGWFLRHVGSFVLATVVALSALYNLAAVTIYARDNCISGGFFPIRSTAITEHLRQALALKPGAPFQGLVATIDGSSTKQSVNWIDLYNNDAHLWYATGNDHRSVGLWRFGIPTLFQYFTFITPPYYVLLTEFLARPTDLQFRSVLVLTRINEAMMRLWGVRYVITDTDAGVGRQVVELPVEKGTSLRLVELPDVNLGDYSPVAVQRVDDFRAGLAALHAPTFDGRHLIVTDAPVEGPFVAATDVRLVYEKYGFHLQAKSAGRSLLVLPSQYSHCWTIAGSGDANLFRANLMQLGVSFTGNLDAKLIFRYGPILAASCRVDDLHDMIRMRVGEARAEPRVAAKSQ